MASLCTLCVGGVVMVVEVVVVVGTLGSLAAVFPTRYRSQPKKGLSCTEAPEHPPNVRPSEQSRGREATRSIQNQSLLKSWLKYEAVNLP